MPTDGTALITGETGAVKDLALPLPPSSEWTRDSSRAWAGRRHIRQYSECSGRLHAHTSSRSVSGARQRIPTLNQSWASGVPPGRLSVSGRPLSRCDSYHRMKNQGDDTPVLLLEGILAYGSRLPFVIPRSGATRNLHFLAAAAPSLRSERQQRHKPRRPRCPIWAGEHSSPVLQVYTRLLGGLYDDSGTVGAPVLHRNCSDERRWTNKGLLCRVSPHSRPLGSLRLSADFRPTPGLLSSYRKSGIVFSDKPLSSEPHRVR